MAKRVFQQGSALCRRALRTIVAFMAGPIYLMGAFNVWLTDAALQQVYKFSPDGRLLMVVDERGVAGADDRHFNRPTQVAVLPDGSFHVADGYLNMTSP